MAKKKRAQELDSTYLLKVVLFFLMGIIWLQIHGHTVLPIGLLLGLGFAQHDHFRIDRKIEYVILLLAAAIGLIGHGIYINF